jgi:hypothetical protein
VTTPPPIDLSPFRILVDFFAAGYVALVSMIYDHGADKLTCANWIEFDEPDIGHFGLSQNWRLPDGEAKERAYGFHVFSGNSLVSPVATLNLVNLGRTLADYPDEERTHVVLDYVFDDQQDPGRSGVMRCEIYRGPPLAEVITHLSSSGIYNALGTTFETVKAAFQYRRDGVVGLIGEAEEPITTPASEQRMRISIPVVGEDHTPTFQLL